MVSSPESPMFVIGGGSGVGGFSADHEHRGLLRMRCACRAARGSRGVWSALRVSAALRWGRGHRGAEGRRKALLEVGALQALVRRFTPPAAVRGSVSQGTASQPNNLRSCLTFTEGARGTAIGLCQARF